MDYLINKLDGTAVSQGGTVKEVKLTTQTGGDKVFVGAERPIDLGDYVLVKAIEVDDPLDPATQKRGPTIETVDVAAQTVTVTYTTVAKTAQELKDDSNNTILAQINILEMSTLRALRDCTRGNGNAPDGLGGTPKGRLDNVEAEITTLREALVP